MCRASSGVNPTFGMPVFGTSAGGFSRKAMSMPGTFGSCPAMKLR
jgi:hypothetical protein